MLERWKAVDEAEDDPAIHAAQDAYVDDEIAEDQLEQTIGQRYAEILASAANRPDQPQPGQPEQGQICIAGIPVFEVEHWVEDGDYVFRSTEFDLVAGASDMKTAVDRFVENADDLWNALEEQDNLTANELELVSLLASRFRRVLHELERREQERRRRRINISLRQRELRTWHPIDRTHHGSSHLSRA